jgi:hypothetical protein
VAGEGSSMNSQLVSRGGYAVISALVALTALVSLSSATARATGTATVRHVNGETDVYHNVEIKVIHNALYVTTEDGKGTIVINDAACSHQGQVMVCYVTKAVLVQAGETSALDFKRGTLYVNSTDDPQQLVLSTTKIAPHSVLLSFTTQKGTYVGVTGRIDKVVK